MLDGETLLMGLAYLDWLAKNPVFLQGKNLNALQLKHVAQTYPLELVLVDGAPQFDANGIMYETLESRGQTLFDLHWYEIIKLLSDVGDFQMYRRFSPWINWFEGEDIVGITKLSVNRGKLYQVNTVHSYPTQLYRGEGQPTGYETFSCTEEQQTTRQLDGTCNDLEDPMMGAAGTRMGRNIPNETIVAPTPEELVTPNPRQISLELLGRPDGEFQEVPFLNLMATAWLQFQTHDWFSHGSNRSIDDDPIHIPLGPNDPMREKYGLEELLIARTAQDTRTPFDDAADMPETFANEVTHWWDASQVYGSDIETAQLLRKDPNGNLVEGGKLYLDTSLDQDGLLPVDGDGLEVTGFRRNFWVGLSLMHTLFAREHNAIAEGLKQEYPAMSDDDIYNKARMINAALIAKIHTVEWTPAILPNPILNQALNINWSGLLGLVDEQTQQMLAPLAQATKDPGLVGIPNSDRDLYDVAFSITEEFTSIYRMHPLLPDDLELRYLGDPSEAGAVVPLENTRAGMMQQADLIQRGELGDVEFGDIVFSFAHAKPGALALHNYPGFLQDLVIPFVTAFDMGTTDIVRDRERGVPRYNEFRRLIGLQPVDSFHDLNDDNQLVAKLKEIYNNDIEELDLLVGALAEGTPQRPSQFGFGETAFQIFLLMASRRLQADRYYTDLFNADVYTQFGMDWIANNNMATVLVRHVPGLADPAIGLGPEDNAFTPIDQWGY